MTDKEKTPIIECVTAHGQNYHASCYGRYAEKILTVRWDRTYTRGNQVKRTDFPRGYCHRSWPFIGNQRCAHCGGR